MLGKRLLPWFGGTSALWTTCQLFFQLALLLGYAFLFLAFGWMLLLWREGSAYWQIGLEIAEGVRVAEECNGDC